MWAVTCIQGHSADVVITVELTQALADRVAAYTAAVARVGSMPGFVSVAFFDSAVDGFGGGCKCAPGAGGTGRECFACQCNFDGFDVVGEIDPRLVPCDTQAVVFHLKTGGRGYFTFYEKYGSERFETPSINLLELLADAGIQPTKENAC